MTSQPLCPSCGTQPVKLFGSACTSLSQWHCPACQESFTYDADVYSFVVKPSDLPLPPSKEAVSPDNTALAPKPDGSCSFRREGGDILSAYRSTALMEKAEEVINDVRAEVDRLVAQKARESLRILLDRDPSDEEILQHGHRVIGWPEQDSIAFFWDDYAVLAYRTRWQDHKLVVEFKGLPSLPREEEVDIPSDESGFTEGEWRIVEPFQTWSSKVSYATNSREIC